MQQERACEGYRLITEQSESTPLIECITSIDILGYDNTVVQFLVIESHRSLIGM